MSRKPRVFNYTNTIKALMDAPLGQERNMYPYVRDLLIHTFKHAPESILTDTKQRHDGGIPDLLIYAGTGVKDEKQREIMHDWAVIEVKDEPDAFGDFDSREKIFAEKSKYVTLGTEYFVMIDTRRIVVRPVAMRSQLTFSPENDISLEWDEVRDNEKKLQETLECLHASHTQELSALKKFRDGDTSQIAAVKVDLPDAEKKKLTKAQAKRLEDARADFLDAVHKSTRILQNACERAMENLEQDIGEMRGKLKTFDEKWKGYTMSFEPVSVTGKDVKGMDEQMAHGQENTQLANYIIPRQALAKLVDRALPAYFARTGHTNTKPFAAESGNLILARILLMRFFEDHGFFEDQKYVCNGGVADLQKFMQHRERGYAIVLRTAYWEGEKIYSAAFDLTDLDWVLGVEDKQISRAVELTMMYFSRFDFATVGGDILTGIYDRFLDRQQRKDMGEFYTPPSIARHMVRRLKIPADARVFDPACGSGTFFLTAFEHMTDGKIANGTGTMEQAQKVLSNLGGNDLNPFSAVMSRIQMLWHLLPLKESLQTRLRQKEHLPEIQISGSHNSLIPLGISRRGGAYEVFDEPTCDFVIGNPPYVRPERASGFADDKTNASFANIGGASKNLYDLFVYKAMTKWCKPAAKGQKPGRLGFIIPLSFCDSKNSEPLRKLFALGGKFRIIEIIDMELIAPHVFDAAVNPIILFAENRPAKKNDRVIISTAGDSCIVNNDLREFNLNRASSETFDYADIWNENGYILTKTNNKRRKIIAKMSGGETLANIARVYWTGRKGNTIVKWRGTPPPENFGNDDNSIVWDEKIMLSRGAVLRGQWQTATSDESGLPLYKGENITACRIEGEPTKQNIVINSVSDPSLWKYHDVLPDIGYAVLRIALGITAAQFNPQTTSFLDTATLFIPNKKWESFPFDTAFLSDVFQFYYAIHLRIGALSHSYRSGLSPVNLRMIPCPSSLLKNEAKLKKLRGEFLTTCENINNRAAALKRILNAGGAVEFAAACDQKNLSVQWSQKMKTESVPVNAPKPKSIKPSKANGDMRISLDNELGLEDSAWFSFADESIARRVAAALTVYHDNKINRDGVLKMLIPKDDKALRAFVREVDKHDKGGSDKDLERIMQNIDAVVGRAFDLTEKEIQYIQSEMENDDFLRNIRPNLPFSGKRQRGLSSSLASPDRYGKRQGIDKTEANQE